MERYDWSEVSQGIHIIFPHTCSLFSDVVSSHIILYYIIDVGGSMSEIVAFSDLQDDVESRIQPLIAGVLEAKRFSSGKVGEWVDSINGQSIEILKKMSPNFKYVTSCIIQQKSGTGLHYSCM